MVLERLSAIYEDDRYLIVVLLPQFRITVDIDFTPYEVGLALGLGERLFDDVAEMTSTAGVHHNFVHKVIVSATQAKQKKCSFELSSSPERLELSREKRPSRQVCRNFDCHF